MLYLLDSLSVPVLFVFQILKILKPLYLLEAPSTHRMEGDMDHFAGPNQRYSYQ